jgi:hypothetical protein
LNSISLANLFIAYTLKIFFSTELNGHFEKGVVIQMINDRIELSKVIELLFACKAEDQPQPIPTQSSLIPTESSAVLSRNVLQENIIPIADLLQGKRKRSGYKI